MQQETTSWYKQEWFIVLSLLFIFPLGLFLMWKFSKWPSIARTIITVAISVIVLASITYYGNLQMIVPATSNSNNETKETTENNVNDKDERNHKTAVEETKTNYDSTKENTKEPGKENESATRLENSALEKAKSYYDDFHISKLGIYDILTSEYGEKFDKEDAQYAIDLIMKRMHLRKQNHMPKICICLMTQFTIFWCLTTVKNLQNQKQNMLLSIWIIKFTDELLSRPIF